MFSLEMYLLALSSVSLEVQAKLDEMCYVAVVQLSKLYATKISKITQIL